MIISISCYSNEFELAAGFLCWKFVGNDYAKYFWSVELPFDSCRLYYILYWSLNVS